MGWLPGDDRPDHGAGRVAVQIGDHDAQTNPAIGQHLVQAVLLGGELPDQLLPLAGHQAQLAQSGRRDERSPQEPRAGQCREPLGIPDIGLATGDILHMPGVHHLSANARRLQRRIRALPVNARALHHHAIRRQSRRPRGQGPPVPLEPPELPLLDARRAIGLLDQRTGRDLCLMHVEPDDALVQCHQFHATFPLVYIERRKVVDAGTECA